MRMLTRQEYLPEQNLWQSFNMKKLLSVFIVFGLFNFPVDASILKFTPDSDTSLKQDVIKKKQIHQIDSLQTYFIDNGYLDVSISQMSDTFYISTGKQFLLRNIYIGAVDTLFYTQTKFRKQFIQIIFDSYLKEYHNDGFQFANLVLDSTLADNNFIDLYCTFIQGPQVKLERLQFSGLTKTKSSLIDKYFSFDDSAITPQLLHSIELTAQSIPYVTYIPPIRQELNQGYQNSRLIIPFQEKSNLLFEGGGGYLSENDLFVWNLLLKFQNIFGGGQDISLLSQKKDTENQHLQISYSQPLFLIGFGRFDLMVQTRDYRSAFYEFLIKSGIESFYKKKLYFGVTGQYKSVELEADNSSYNSTEISLSVSNTNDRGQSIQPGFKYKSIFRYGQRKYSSDTTTNRLYKTNYNESRIDMQTESIIRLINRLHVISTLHFQSYQTDENLPPISELFLVGGPGTIRGFKDEQFASIRNLTFTFEPFFNFESTNLFLFYDGGYLFNRTASEISDFDEVTIYRYGYGFGLFLDNINRLFKISFGWNKNLPLDNPYISLQLKTNL